MLRGPPGAVGAGPQLQGSAAWGAASRHCEVLFAKSKLGSKAGDSFHTPAQSGSRQEAGCAMPLASLHFHPSCFSEVPCRIRSFKKMKVLGKRWQRKAVYLLCGCTRPWTHGKDSLINVGFLLALFDGTRLRHSISVSLCRAMCIRESSISHVLTPE